jgi:hypothetical protein
MNQTDRTSALAGNDERVCSIVLITPTDSALNLILTGIINVLGALDLHGLSQFLLIKLLFRHVYVVAPEVFYSKSDTTKLDSVEFFDFVVILAILIFQRSGDQPEPINRFLFLLLGSDGVIKIVTL